MGIEQILVVLDLPSSREAILRSPYVTSYDSFLPPPLKPSEFDIAHILPSPFSISCLPRLVFKDAELYNLKDSTLA